MKQGYVILIVIALLFIGMYAFATFSVYMVKWKQKKERKDEMRIEAMRLEEKARKQEERDMKWKKMEERRAEMKKDLVRLEEIKQEWIKKGKIKPEKNKA
ncbi:MAG TPA: hypothetical protein VKN14_00950 [Flavobacteriaceae bacterium]|nr:hypothetical protein [Flavobacteriaceae bacterium]